MRLKFKLEPALKNIFYWLFNYIVDIQWNKLNFQKKQNYI
jgi:hypothetical protein